MHTPQWLKNAVFYNIYPQSFCDTNEDGIGDLNGVTSKLDYIASLGCNAIWLNPIYVSPFRDGGYDVTDFYKVAPRYGTNDDFVTLAAEAKKRFRGLIPYMYGVIRSIFTYRAVDMHITIGDDVVLVSAVKCQKV